MLSKLDFHQKQSNLLRRPISHAQTMKPMVKWIEMIIKDRIRMKNKESEKMCSNNKKNIRSEESKRVQCIEILMLHVFDDNKQESVDFLRYRCNARMQFKRKYITLLLNLYKSLQHIRSFFCLFSSLSRCFCGFLSISPILSPFSLKDCEASSSYPSPSQY